MRSAGMLPLLSFALLMVSSDVRAELDKKDHERREGEEARPVLDGDEHAQEHERLADLGKKNLEEIQRLLDEVQNNLGRRDTGDATQALQKNAVERLDELIKELGKGCGQCSGGSPSGSPKSSSSSKEEQTQRQQQQKESEQPMRQRRERMQAQEQKPDGKQNERNDRQVENDRTEEGDLEEERIATLKDRMRRLERWGVLPPKLTEEMLSSSGKEVPPEYREIISRYYKRMTEFYEKRSR